MNYKVFETDSQLYIDTPLLNETVNISEITAMDKPFEKRLVSPKAKAVISRLRMSSSIHLLKSECKFKIGYVCGNKNYFHPDEATIGKYRLPKENLIPCILNAKGINGNPEIVLDAPAGIEINRSLFYPRVMDAGTKRYIQIGEERKVHQGYKCRVRNPWYKTPGIEIPDLILTVFGDVPKLVANSGRYAVSNSLLSGQLTGETPPKNLICRWYNSLTLLLIEITIHSLGGGTLVLIPGETDKMEMLNNFPDDLVDKTYSQLFECMKKQGIERAYELGNEIVLKRVYGLSDGDVEAIQDSLACLREWRIPDKRRG